MSKGDTATVPGSNDFTPATDYIVDTCTYVSNTDSTSCTTYTESPPTKDIDSATCYVSTARSEFIVWEKDAFRKCMFSNTAMTAARR